MRRYVQGWGFCLLYRFWVSIVNDTILWQQFFIIFFLFNQILCIGTVPGEVPSAAHTLRDVLPLGPQHVSSIVFSLRMGTDTVTMLCLLVFFISLLSFNTRCWAKSTMWKIPAYLTYVSLSHFEKCSRHSGRLQCRNLSQKILKITKQIKTLS